MLHHKYCLLDDECDMTVQSVFDGLSFSQVLLHVAKRTITLVFCMEVSGPVPVPCATSHFAMDSALPNPLETFYFVFGCGKLT